MDYVLNEDAVKHLYNYAPQIESFAAVIEDKQQQMVDRILLQDVLRKQYQKLAQSEKVQVHIENLSEANTFTICTAHQLNIFTGPLYIVYKALSIIKLADQLNETYAEYNFVPVFWLGSEDHDLAEINHFNLFSDSYTWETGQTGATGRMDASSLEDVYSLFQERLRNEDLKELLEKSYLDSANLADATRSILNALFGERGLVVLDADDSKLKSAFAESMKGEMIEQISSLSIKKNLEFLDANYKVQASPREINLFYIKDAIRERIVYDQDRWTVLKTELSWSENELIDELNSHPERFSPNVILRPVYQEFILPNLAYIGGAGELAYWLQLKDVFSAFKVNFPVLLPRDMNLLIEEKKMAKWNKLGFAESDFFQKDSILKNRLVSCNSEERLDLEVEKEQLKALFQDISEKAKKIDASLAQSAEAEAVKVQKILDGLEKRILKAEKSKHNVSLNQVSALLAKFFPNGGPQERSENILAYLDKYGMTFLDDLYEAADPLDLSYSILEI